MNTKIKKLAMISLLAGTMVVSTGCMAIQSGVKNIKADVSGLERKVEVYSMDGSTLLREYEGKILVTDGDGGTITIEEYGGKKHTFCNATVIVDEK